MRSELPDRRQQVMGAVHVIVENRYLVLKGIADKTRSGQVVAFVRLQILDNLYQGEDIVERRDMEIDPVEYLSQVFQLVLGIFDGNATDNAMDFVPLGKKEFRKIRAILTGNTGYQRFFHGVLTCPIIFSTYQRYVSFSPSSSPIR